MHSRDCKHQTPHRRRPSTFFVLFVCFVASAVASAQERPAWWDGRWRYRELVSINPDQEFMESPFACVWVHVRQDADRGGRDIRVVAPDGRPVPFAVLYGSAEGRYLVAFQAPQKDGLYAVYYDNQYAEDVAPADPGRGLVHETRPIPAGAVVSSWADAQAVLAEAGPPFGAACWNRVFDAHNPFGPQTDYIGIYRGYVACPEDGAYSFATVSDQSSFLLVDGRLVAQWVGPHGIHQGQRGEHSGTVELTRGMHAFFYVHFSFGGPARAEAAWMPPGADGFEIMPHSAFPGLPEADVFEGEWFRQPLCADFTARPESYCEVAPAGGAGTGSDVTDDDTGATVQMTAVKFASKSTSAGDALIDSYLWDFGDGQAATGPQPQHVFLAPGVYTVTLGVTSTAGDRTSCAKKVQVGPIYEDLDFPLKKVQAFWDAAKGYQLGTLSTPSLLALWDFAKRTEKTRESYDVARELDKRLGELGPARAYALAMALGKYYEDVERQPDAAEQYFQLALKTAPESDTQRRFKARFALCDHHFYYREQPERAREEYRKLREDFPQADAALRRVALIRIGDTFAFEGKAQEALAPYREAEADPAYAPSEPRPLLSGAMLQEVQSYLRSGDGAEALRQLEQLLWHYPTMRLDGEPALLRVKANLMMGRFDEANKQAVIFIRFSKDPNWLPAVHVQAAEACIELGLMEEAGGHYKAVLTDFPESPQVKDAEAGLRRLEK
jgi:tetratricopeptide (TPR) repeat protein